jgi:hypothetical protein
MVHPLADRMVDKLDEFFFHRSRAVGGEVSRVWIALAF